MAMKRFFRYKLCSIIFGFVGKLSTIYFLSFVSFNILILKDEMV